MGAENKVLWSEGMFLRPQHMQQQDRYYDQQLRRRTQLLQRHYWGVHRLEMDQQLLDMGTLAIRRCEGILPDGTFFNIDSADGDRLLLDSLDIVQDQKVCIALPIVLAGADESTLSDDSLSLTRFHCHPLDIKDSNLGHSKVAKLNTAKLKMKLLLEGDLTADYTAMGIFHVQEISSEGRLKLNENYIPPLITISANQTLSNCLKETIGLLSHRSEAIASRLRSEAAGASDVADFMLLQLVNRYHGIFSHLQKLKQVHPEELFQLCVELYSELSTFTSNSKRPELKIIYNHDDLMGSFQALMGALRQSLSMVFEQSAIQIALQERRYGVHVAPIPDRRLLQDASFILGIKSEWSKEMTAARIPSVIKVAGVEQLRDLVNLQLPGIKVEPLTVAPRQIAYHSGFTYFQLEKKPENWALLEKSGGVAFHFSGDIPNLDIQLWAIKE